MSKLLKYLKGHLLPIFFIFILLIIQAFCELSLPDYTSDIVNVGIQQGGIDSRRQRSSGKVSLIKSAFFLRTAKSPRVKDNYTLVSAGIVSG